MPGKHIPHIVGLRGVAVLFIICFHLSLQFFPGGYIGVDIFFVISGFLITRMVVQEFDATATFDFRRFYLRRARRLLPGLFFVLFFTLAFAFLLFTPLDFQRLGDVIWRCALAVANLYFWKESDYFDAVASLKPLLHTWSLSVEEQFYLVWPLSLFAILRIGRTIAALRTILLLLGASYGLVLVCQSGDVPWLNKLSPSFANGISTVFYLTPFRIFEFLTGALVLWTRAKYPDRENSLLSGLGILLISIPAFCFSESLVGSAAYNILPCLGTAILLHSGASGLASKVLHHPVLQRIGNLSYSLYLVHWPVIVFLKYYKDFVFTWQDQLLAASLTYVLALLVNILVENPFRYATRPLHLKNSVLFILCCLGGSVFFYAVGNNINEQRGWTWRISPAQQKLIADLKDPKQFHIDHNGGALHGKNGYLDPGSPSQVDIILIGDSHAQQYTQGLYEILDRKHGKKIFLVQISQIFLPDFRRSNRGDNYYQIFNGLFAQALQLGAEHPDAVYMIAEAWEDQLTRSTARIDGSARFSRVRYDVEGIGLVIAKIKKLKELLGPRHKLIVFGGVPGTQNSDGTLNALLRPDYIPRHADTSAAFGDEQGKAYEINRIFATQLPAIEGVYFLNPYEVLSNHGHPLFLIDNKIVYSDDSHLSLDGSVIVIEYFENRILEIIGERPSAGQKVHRLQSALPIGDLRPHFLPGQFPTPWPR